MRPECICVYKRERFGMEKLNDEKDSVTDKREKEETDSWESKGMVAKRNQRREILHFSVCV